MSQAILRALLSSPEEMLELFLSTQKELIRRGHFQAEELLFRLASRQLYHWVQSQYVGTSRQVDEEKQI
jgi:hypothetical protein